MYNPGMVANVAGAMTGAQGSALRGMINQTANAWGNEHDSRVSQNREWRRMQHEKEIERMRQEAVLLRLQAEQEMMREQMNAQMRQQRMAADRKAGVISSTKWNDPNYR